MMNPAHTLIVALFAIVTVFTTTAYCQDVHTGASNKVGQQNPDLHLRKWTDSSGKHSVMAEFVDSSDRSVRLRKADGHIIRVPLDRLSKVDVAFIKEQAQTDEATQFHRALQVTSAERLERIARRMNTAAEVVSLYTLFLTDPAVPEAEKKIARSRLKKWEEYARQEKIRVGTKWCTPEEFQDLQQDEADLIKEADGYFELGDFDQGCEKLLEASLANPDGIRADFRLGLIHALLKRDAAWAKTHFAKCVDRRLTRREHLTQVEKANLVASLNNLALSNIREGVYGAALKEWRTAIGLGPPPPELIQNLGRLGFLARKHAKKSGDPRASIRLTPGQAQRFDEMYMTKRVALSGDGFREGTGWLYMPIIREATSGILDSQSDTDRDVQSKVRKSQAAAELRIIGSGTGFVVAPHFVITNAHVAEDAAAFSIVSSVHPGDRLPGTTEAISDDSALDLALIRCETLEAPAIQFCPVKPKLGAEIRLLGFPLSNALGSSLKVTRGIISGLPPHTGMLGALRIYRDYLLYDAVINPGNSGGPACNEQGLVVAINTAILLPHAIGGGYAAGVPAEKAVQFLNEHVPEWKSNTTDEASNSSWEKAVEKVGESTVQILILQHPTIFDRGNDFWKERKKKRDLQSLEDPWCMACYGTDKVECPVRRCLNGGVRSYRIETKVINGVRIAKKIPIRVDCKTCSGSGFVSCRNCISGIDPLVSRN